MVMKIPFPYFGGKSRPAAEIWYRLGKVRNYVEPFAGGLGCLLQRQDWQGQTETVNDIDGFICNFWRAIKRDAAAVAYWANWPVNEIDLQARHQWLMDQRIDLTADLIDDPDWYNAKVAGYWCWGACCWIGHGWCKARQFAKQPYLNPGGRGVNRQRPDLADQGKGINRNNGEGIRDYLMELKGRLRQVRVCCGDWGRVVTPAVTTRHGLTGVLLDPPYKWEGRSKKLYAYDSDSVADEAFQWAVANWENPKLRIAFCCLDGDFTFPKGWTDYAWQSLGGKKGVGGSQRNKDRERIWFSPTCVK